MSGCPNQSLIPDAFGQLGVPGIDKSDEFVKLDVPFDADAVMAIHTSRWSTILEVDA